MNKKDYEFYCDYYSADMSPRHFDAPCGNVVNDELASVSALTFVNPSGWRNDALSQILDPTTPTDVVQALNNFVQRLPVGSMCPDLTDEELLDMLPSRYQEATQEQVDAFYQALVTLEEAQLGVDATSVTQLTNIRNADAQSAPER